MSRSQPVRLLRSLLPFAVLGLAAGVGWFLVAPRPAFVVRGEGVGYVKDLPGEYVAMDGWFATFGLVAGVLVAVAVLRRHGTGIGARTLVAASFLGLVGSLIAWVTGRLLGRAEAVPPEGDTGAVFLGALELTARGVLLVWPVTTLAILTFAVAWTSRDQPATEAASVRGDGDLAGLDRG